MTFKEKLIRLRKIKGLTQDEFASAIGVSRQAVYKWECGQSYPEVPKLLEIKLLFNESLDNLLDDSYEIPMPEKKKRKRSSPKKNSEKVEEKIAPVIEKEVAKVTQEVVKEEKIIPEVKVEKEENNTSLNEVEVEEKRDSFFDRVDSQPKEEEKRVGFFSKLFGRK